MKSNKASLLIAVVILMVFAMPATVLAQGPGSSNSDVSKVKAADFRWMSGRWIGHLPTATAEQLCSSVESGEMLCLFRIFVQGQPVMYEMYTIYDTPRGVEIRSLNFPTDLVDKQLQTPLLMVLQKFSDKEVVFAGAPGAQVDTSTLQRDSATTMNGIIMFRDQKEPHVRVRWEKVGYDAKVDYLPPAPAKK